MICRIKRSGCWWCKCMGNIFFYTLGPLMPMKNRLNAADYLANVAASIYDYAASIPLLATTSRQCTMLQIKNSGRLVRETRQ